MKKAEIIAVGTELLTGQIVNTNARFLSLHLPETGYACYYQTVCGDNPGRLTECLEIAAGRADLIILSGGLGPTQDDLTKKTVADFLGLGLIRDAATENNIRDYFRKTGKTMTESNLKQADFPEGGTVLENNNGTAPGCGINAYIKGKNVKIIMLPGPPKELEPMFCEVADFLTAGETDGLCSEFLTFCGISESLCEEKIRHIIEGKNPTAATYVKDGVITVRVTAGGPERERMLRVAADEIINILGDFFVSREGLSPQSMLTAIFSDMNIKLYSEELGTGGLAAVLLSEADSFNRVFERGTVNCRLGGISGESRAMVSIYGDAGLGKGCVNFSLRTGGKTYILSKKMIFGGSNRNFRTRLCVTALFYCLRFIRESGLEIGLPKCYY